MKRQRFNFICTSLTEKVKPRVKTWLGDLAFGALSS